MKNLQRYCTSGFAAEFLVHQPRAGRGPHPEPTSCLSARFFVVKNKQARSKTTEVGRQTKRRRNGQTAERAGRGKKRRLRRRSSDLNFMRLLRGGQGCGNCTLCLQCLHLAAPPLSTSSSSSSSSNNEEAEGSESGGRCARLSATTGSNCRFQMENK